MDTVSHLVSVLAMTQTAHPLPMGSGCVVLYLGHTGPTIPDENCEFWSTQLQLHYELGISE